MHAWSTPRCQSLYLILIFPTFAQSNVIIRAEDEEEGEEKQLDSISLQLHSV